MSNEKDQNKVTASSTENIKDKSCGCPDSHKEKTPCTETKEKSPCTEPHKK